MLSFASRLVTDTLTAEDRHSLTFAILTLFAVAVFAVLARASHVTAFVEDTVVQFQVALGATGFWVFIASAGTISAIAFGMLGTFVWKGLFSSTSDSSAVGEARLASGACGNQED